jgi:hypothetical protein
MGHLYLMGMPYYQVEYSLLWLQSNTSLKGVQPLNTLDGRVKEGRSPSYIKIPPPQWGRGFRRWGLHHENTQPGK